MAGPIAPRRLIALALLAFSIAAAQLGAQATRFLARLVPQVDAEVRPQHEDLR
jgi:hypothetical protein